MTIERLLYDISEIALKNNLVNSSYAGPSIYQVNGDTVRSYPYVFTSPTDEIRAGENTTAYGLTLYYVDRLLADNSNETDIFSVGVETLKNIIRQLDNHPEIVDISENPVIRLFTETQKMADSCAGAYVRFEVVALNTAACPVYFDADGEPLGTYIPSSVRDASVLDAFAKKEDLARLSASTKEQIATLSAATAGIPEIRADLGDLSASTIQEVSSLTEALESLETGTSEALRGKQDILTAGNNITIEQNVISARGNVRSATVFDIVSLTQEEYDALGQPDANTLYIIVE